MQFWEARLIEKDGKLVDDHDWSPEHGPQDGSGNTYSQELAWDLFAHYRGSHDCSGQDRDYADRSPACGTSCTCRWSARRPGGWRSGCRRTTSARPAHRHLSPLIGFFPGDRIAVDTAPPELIDGVRNLLTARGMDSFGWACAGGRRAGRG